MIRRKNILLLLVVALSMVACVQRDLTVTSEPSGAVVYIHGMSNREIGRTPVTIPFTWYGDYDIQLRLDGYEALNTHASLTAPWYEIPPIDLMSEMAPWTYHDRRYLHFELQPAEPTSDEDLLRRAGDLRERNAEPAKTEAPKE